MTAEMASRVAVEGTWAGLRRLREQWILLVFFAGALIGLRDTYDEFAKLPALARQQVSGLATLEAKVTQLDAEVMRRFSVDQSPVVAFPGTKHSVDDGAPGAWTVLHLRPVRRLRKACVPRRIDAWMVGRDEQWFTVETSVTLMPALEGETDLDFGVRVHPLMKRGRARVLVQISFDCGGYPRAETTPWLHFRVLDT